MEAQELLSSYGQLVGLRGVAFDAHGCARLKFSEDAAVNLEADPAGECIHLYAVLGPVPSTSRERLYRELLEGNLFGTRTRGGALAIDKVQEEVILCRRVDLARADASALKQMLDEFVSATQHWQDAFDSGDLTVEQTTSAGFDEQMDWRLRG
jgi:hypothetical protein